MAPMSPARMTSRVTTSRSIIPLPMVLATWVPSTKAATKLKKAAHRTAFCGESTRVETTVAMEFAASWNPFRKSNVSATRMMKMRTAKSLIAGSGVLDDDVPDGVGVVAALVAGVLEAVVDFLPLQDLDRVLPRLEQVGVHGAVQRVGLVLELRDPHDGGVDLLVVGQVPDLRRHLVHFLDQGAEDARELAQRVRRV